jgi:type IV pilus assembly protein PilO
MSGLPSRGATRHDVRDIRGLARAVDPQSGQGLAVARGGSVEKFKSLGFGVQVGITLAIMIVVGIVAWKWLPNFEQKHEEIRQKQAKLDELTAEIQKGINLEKKLPELEREIEDLQLQLEELKTIMPPARIDSDIVAKLESVAKRSRLAIRAITANRPRKKDFYDEYPIAIEVQANYHDLAKFFDRIAHLPRIFNVTGVDLRQFQGGGGGTSPYSLSASFTAVTFIYREEEPPATPAAGAPATPPAPH